VPFFYVFVKLNAFNMSLLASECSEAPRQATIPILYHGVDEKNPARRQDFSLAFGAYGSSFYH
jgi:hypothetical protein